MTRAGIVIVTFNSENQILECLDAALARSSDVVVVDNASADATCERVRARPRARLLANSLNRGFAAAANLGIAALDCECVLLLNPDAVLLTGVEDLADACLRPGAAAAGGKLLDDTGRPQRGFLLRRLPTPWTLAFEALGLNRLLPRNPVNRRYRCLDLDPDQPTSAEQPAGAFLMIRRDAWREIGGFDERFHPLWYEDVDFCKRLLDRGYRLEYCPSAVARHSGGHSICTIPWDLRQVYWYANLLRYVAKHFSRLAVRGVSAAVLVGSIARVMAGICAQRNLKPALIYGKVVRFAFRCLVSGLVGEVKT
jgi:GT2 family glycosyltransferase